MRSLLLLLLTLALPFYCLAQTNNTFNVDLPQLLPASPEPSGFVKAGLGKPNMSTGAITASIPIHTVHVRDFIFPISLDYSSQGLKVDEATSRVGTGWILNATGMITRVVKGRPDEFATRLSVPAAPEDNTDSNYYYYLNATQEQSLYDTQADEFNFSFNGYSGKFVLDSNLIPRVTSTSNLQIDVDILVSSVSGDISKITIVAPDGIKYEFGNRFEKTITHNVSGHTTYKDRTKTVFFLDKVSFVTGETVNFNYSPIQTEVVTGYSQTLKNSAYRGGLGDCIECGSLTSYSSVENKIIYQTQFLTSIITSYGPTVTFNYEDRPDLTGDNRLKAVNVEGLKTFLFEYYDVPGTSHNMGRYFLTAIKESRYGAVEDSLKSKDFHLYYNSLQSVPLPISFSQDYLGFYNGKNNSYLIPAAYNMPVEDFSHRNPNPAYSKMGVLSKIQYPTGGIEEYLVEGNTRYERTIRDTKASEQIDGIGGTTLFQTYNSPLISNVRTQNVIMQLWATDAIANDGYTADPQYWTVKVDFYQGSNLIASRSSTGYIMDTLQVGLAAGLSYRWVMTVKSSTEMGHSKLTYDTSAVTIYDTINAAIPGIRLRQIKYIDSISNSTFSKYYTYASFENLNISTGSAYNASYKAINTAEFYCGEYYSRSLSCTITSYSTSGTDLVYGIAGSGSPIYYTSVIESDNSNFENGATEYQFYPNDAGYNSAQIMGEDMSGLPGGHSPTLSGQIHKKKVYNNLRELIEEEQYIFGEVAHMENRVISMNIRSRYNTYLHLPNRMEPFDVVRIVYFNRWLRQEQVIGKKYSNGELSTNKTEYNYGTNANVLPSSVITQNSQGVIISTETKYPTDFDTDPVMQKLLEMNIRVPIIQVSEKLNGVLSQQKFISYRDWFNNSKVVLPDTSKVKRTALDALRPELVVNKYDSIGNVLEVQRHNDIRYAYLWNSRENLPICEVLNARFEQIAFTSFEEEENLGGWNVVNGGIDEGESFIGFSFFSGSLSKSINIQGKYIVTLWTKASATVNGTGGSQIRTHRGWKLMQWKLTNPTQVTVTGTSIDDLRLYPQDASMVTFNYKRFVGVNAKSDENCNVTYFEYDGFNRLYLVRDIDKNVLKKYCYNFAGKQENCDYYSAAKSATFTRNNCSIGYTGSIITYTVPAGKYISTTSQADADQKAIDDLNANGQVYANSNGTCTQYICSTTNCSGIDKKCINNVCETAVRVNLSSVWMKVDGVNWKWKCTWRYRWSDCSVSQDYVEYNDASCTVSGSCGATEM